MAADLRGGINLTRVLRRAVPSDACVLERIAESSPGAPGWSVGTYSELDQSGFLSWVVQIHGEVVGFLIGRAMADEAEILNLTVAPEHRRRGHATALVQEALGTFRTQGARRVLLEVRESNRGAVRFYESLGFRRAGRRPNYYPTPPEAAWCMVLELPSSIKR